MKMKFIANKDSLDCVRERMEQYQHIFECLAQASEKTLAVLDKIEATKGPIKAAKLKAQALEYLGNSEWDFDGFFIDSYDEELAETIRLMKEAFGQEEEEFQIRDFAPPVD
jgi:hypothetical protein